MQRPTHRRRRRMRRKYLRSRALGANAAENRQRCYRCCPIRDAIGVATKDGFDADLDHVGEADVVCVGDASGGESGETMWRRIRHSRKRPVRPDSCA